VNWLVHLRVSEEGELLEHQLNFNYGIEDAIDTAKLELSKIKTTDSDTRDAVQRAEMSLDEGAQALSIRQKHIKIADRSDLSWSTVKHYMAETLADGPKTRKRSPGQTKRP